MRSHEMYNFVTGREKPHMYIWPLNMYLLLNISEELSEVNFIHVPGPQLNWQKPLNVFEAMENVLN